MTKEGEAVNASEDDSVIKTLSEVAVGVGLLLMMAVGGAKGREAKVMVTVLRAELVQLDEVAVAVKGKGVTA